MIPAFCLCEDAEHAQFIPEIEYRDETVFKRFEGNIIARCSTCGLLRTIAPASNTYYDPAQSRGDYYIADRVKFTRLFEPIVNRILKYKNGNRVLDVGCSSGLLLSLLKDRGMDVHGVEPNDGAYDIARREFGARIFHGYSSEFVARSRTPFDVVVYNHVLEHIEDVHTELSIIRKLLKKKGIVLIGVPDADNIVYKVRRKYWEYLMPNEHVWHFSHGYMKALLRHAGFTILDTYFTNDARSDYPLVKRLYFGMMGLANTVIQTGEAVLFIAQYK